MALIAPRNVILLARITNKWNDTVMGGRGMMGRLIGRPGWLRLVHNENARSDV
jgi:hypothetical protein